MVSRIIVYCHNYAELETLNITTSEHRAIIFKTIGRFSIENCYMQLKFESCEKARTRKPDY